jgi:hypothetical protein
MFPSLDNYVPVSYIEHSVVIRLHNIGNKRGHDSPADILALSPLDPKTALTQIEKLNLGITSKIGTTRSAALDEVRRLLRLFQAMTKSPLEYRVTNGSGPKIEVIKFYKHNEKYMQ